MPAQVGAVVLAPLPPFLQRDLERRRDRDRQQRARARRAACRRTAPTTSTTNGWMFDRARSGSAAGSGCSRAAGRRPPRSTQMIVSVGKSAEHRHDARRATAPIVAPTSGTRSNSAIDDRQRRGERDAEDRQHDERGDAGERGLRQRAGRRRRRPPRRCGPAPLEAHRRGRAGASFSQRSDPASPAAERGRRSGPGSSRRRRCELTSPRPMSPSTLARVADLARAASWPRPAACSVMS